MKLFTQNYLERMWREPGIYIPIPPYFTGLLHMVHGIRDTLYAYAPDSCELEVLNGFNDWLAKKCDVDLPPLGWYQIISDLVDGDKKRVGKFCEFMIEYIQECNNSDT